MPTLVLLSFITIPWEIRMKERMLKQVLGRKTVNKEELQQFLKDLG